VTWGDLPINIKYGLKKLNISFEVLLPLYSFFNLPFLKTIIAGNPFIEFVNEE
jgi:hypothetical protein